VVWGAEKFTACVFSRLSVGEGNMLFRKVPIDDDLVAVWKAVAYRSFDKAELNSNFRGKYIHNKVIRIQVSPIFKLSGTPD
jgi:hypothetical protein